MLMSCGESSNSLNEIIYYGKKNQQAKLSVVSYLMWDRLVNQ